MDTALPTITPTGLSDTYAKFELSPLAQGYGVTIANALRRVLLSSLQGGAVTAVHIDGIRHEFSDIPGVKEDVTEFILNLKKVRLRSFSDEPIQLSLDAIGEADVTAGDIRESDQVEIVNPDQHLCTIDQAGARLTAYIVVERGIGYHDITDQREESPIGLIPVDGIFSPIERVNFTIEHTRVGQMTNYEKLILEIWTDGTIQPGDAMTQAAEILTEHFHHLAGFGRDDLPVLDKPTSTGDRPTLPPKQAATPIEDLNLSARAENSLKRAGITTVGQLLAMNPQDLMDIRNFGQKSYNELVERLIYLKFVPEDFGISVVADGGEG